MKSSTGAHYLALDHVRALAAFLVFAWHFMFALDKGYPVPLDDVPRFFPFALFSQGHIGVALFMTLSGYLFAKLLDGKSVNYAAFLWNRALRLLPLLFVVLLVAGISEVARGITTPVEYIRRMVGGTVLPILPNGGWSVTVEFHFYVLLPLILVMLRKTRWLPLAIIAAALCLRILLYRQRGEIQSLAYLTLLGRIDQFVFGILLWSARSWVRKRHLLVAATLTAFLLFYWWFGNRGGFFLQPSFPSPSPLWIIIPTLEGLVFGMTIAWYDNSFTHSAGTASRFLGRIGDYSYSIYLLHFFVVYDMSRFVHEHVMDISNFYLALIWSVPFFVAMLIPGFLSYRYLEGPFLSLRKRYIRGPRDLPAPAAEAA